ncbi:unnamed protein product [Bursaphelenchus okinawaensis]|uniref:Uncharacterized protein n=1 Tax=Bursaphelenchus okinawaensis TaxID=465554 RepID=A0A811LII7_9BILA|nr:unnamed protein product [Bursaphelenchus okinawaensis]CAG9124005.1 unnamed protein product [Bursaphelenchus okinawaensis]
MFSYHVILDTGAGNKVDLNGYTSHQYTTVQEIVDGYLKNYDSPAHFQIVSCVVKDQQIGPETFIFKWKSPIFVKLQTDVITLKYAMNDNEFLTQQVKCGQTDTVRQALTRLLPPHDKLEIITYSETVPTQSDDESKLPIDRLVWSGAEYTIRFQLAYGYNVHFNETTTFDYFTDDTTVSDVVRKTLLKNNLELLLEDYEVLKYVDEGFTGENTLWQEIDMEELVSRHSCLKITYKKAKNSSTDEIKEKLEQLERTILERAEADQQNVDKLRESLNSTNSHIHTVRHEINRKLEEYFEEDEDDSDDEEDNEDSQKIEAIKGDVLKLSQNVDNILSVLQTNQKFEQLTQQNAELVKKLQVATSREHEIKNSQEFLVQAMHQATSEMTLKLANEEKEKQALAKELEKTKQQVELSKRIFDDMTNRTIDYDSLKTRFEAEREKVTELEEALAQARTGQEDFKTVCQSLTEDYTDLQKKSLKSQKDYELVVEELKKEKARAFETEETLQKELDELRIDHEAFLKMADDHELLKAEVDELYYLRAEIEQLHDKHAHQMIETQKQIDFGAIRFRESEQRNRQLMMLVRDLQNKLKQEEDAKLKTFVVSPEAMKKMLPENSESRTDASNVSSGTTEATKTSTEASTNVAPTTVAPTTLVATTEDQKESVTELKTQMTDLKIDESNESMPRLSRNSSLSNPEDFEVVDADFLDEECRSTYSSAEE